MREFGGWCSHPLAHCQLPPDELSCGGSYPCSRRACWAAWRQLRSAAATYCMRPVTGLGRPWPCLCRCHPAERRLGAHVGHPCGHMRPLERQENTPSRKLPGVESRGKSMHQTSLFCEASSRLQLMCAATFRTKGPPNVTT